MARSRGGGRLTDLLISLAVLLIPIVLIAWFFTRDTDGPTVDTVDWRPVAEQAASEASFDVLAPTIVPESWRATRARWTTAGHPGLDGEPVAGNTWQLGFLDNRPMYVGLDQSDAPAASFISDVTRGGTAKGTSTVGAQEWTRYASADGRTRALVLTTDESTAIVSGDLPYEELESFAQLLAVA
ncbi:DUF4245 domain-containing protein [Propionicicella superfundia]|uniref:DUF4245 domain-containing protein n=1 Tax=Propionicicella superfundia TaxID=348582 RepID=UPI00146B4C74|nr:DUF4245 domain-containing protein [Propionicicella superfundia]